MEHSIKSPPPGGLAAAHLAVEEGVRLATAADGDRADNLQRAIACYKAALPVITESAHPQLWATLQNNLGSAWGALRAGDRAANLREAIACFERALRVLTENAHPQLWAEAQNNLGSSLE